MASVSLTHRRRAVIAAASAWLIVFATSCTDRDALDTVSPPLLKDAGSPISQIDAAPLAWRRGNTRSTLADAVGVWNDNIVRFCILAETSPPQESRIYAMASVVIHDVMNAVDRRYEPYVYGTPVTEPVSVEAAIATGTHDVLAAIGSTMPDPGPLEFIDEAYTEYLSALGVAGPITRGVQLGHDAAASLLASRQNDGSNGPPASLFVSSGEPGAYRPTLLPSPNGLTGLAALGTWGTVRTFVLTSADQFRPPPMYGASTVAEAVATPAYLADYAEVKRLGGVVSERTQEQSDIGLFWDENTVPGWNRIARTLGAQRHLDAWNLARLTAQVSLAIADGYISVFEAKYHYKFWRPVTAIRLGNMDASTPGDLTWDVATTAAGLGPTPPIPEYSSAHAVAASAAAEAIMANLDGPARFTVESATLPGKPRSFNSIADAVKENADSRIYIGYHFREATRIGTEQGRQIGQYVASHALQRIHTSRGPGL